MRHILYLHGFASGAQSTKAVWLAGRLKERRQGVLAGTEPRGVPLHTPDFNQPDFRTLTVARMLDDVERVIAPLEGPVTLMGSSLGALVAYHAAVANPRVDRLVLLAPALDIARSFRRGLGEGQVEQWREQGWLDVFHYGFKEPRRIDYAFFEDASRYDPFSTPLDLPILIFQGRRDEAVSPEMVERFASTRSNVELHMLDDDHQLMSSLEYIWERSARFLDVPGPRRHEERSRSHEDR